MTSPASSVGEMELGLSNCCIILHVHQLKCVTDTKSGCSSASAWWYEALSSLCLLTVVDRRGESEESGDDETRRRSINGDVDPNQPPNTSKFAHAQHVCHVERDTSLTVRCDITQYEWSKVWWQAWQHYITKLFVSVSCLLILYLGEMAILVYLI